MRWTMMVVGILGLLTGLASAVASSEGVDGERLSASSLDWLTGCWRGEQSEECWLPPAHGTLLGVNRDAQGRSFEFLRIVEESGQLTYWASPGGACPATPFIATTVSNGRVVFENPEHDFPQRIEYWVAEDGTLHARVTASRDGREDGFELVWEPVRKSVHDWNDL